MKVVMRVVLAVCFLAGGLVHAQSLDSIKSQADLDKVMLDLDKQLFDAYNSCDLPKFASFVDENVEFYHDKGGVTLGKQALVDSIRKNICTTDTHRVAVPGTLEAHLMNGYGFIQIGVHRFEHPKTHGETGEGRFVTLWQYKDGAWKMTRCLSFDHKIVSASSK